MMWGTNARFGWRWRKKAWRRIQGTPFLYIVLRGKDSFSGWAECGRYEAQVHAYGVR